MIQHKSKEAVNGEVAYIPQDENAGVFGLDS